MAQYIIHAAPYSSPNSSKRIKSNWAVQNLKVFQENPNAGGGVFARFDLVNTSNPKDKKYTINFSFADGTSMTANAINRIRRFFNEAYDRQRSSGYGFPQLSDADKTQIVARINTAYNQFAGFSHSDEDADVIDCTSDHIEHASRSSHYSSNVSYTRRYGFGGEPNYGTLTVTRGRGEANLYDVTLDRKGARFGFVAKSSDSVDEIKQKLKSATNNDKILAPDEVNNTANLIKAVLREAVSKYSSQHPGYYSPNLQHSDDYLEHSSARLQSVFKYATEEGKHTYIPDRILTDKADHIGVAFYSSKDNGINVYVPINQLSNKNQIKVKFALALRNKDSKATIVPGTDDLMADLIAGRLSLSHSVNSPDYLSVKMSAIDDLDDNYLEHHGILGMKWGIRRYQNADGSLTDAGRKRYGLGDPEYQRKKGIKTTEEVAQTINRINSGKEIAKDVHYFNSSTGNENDFKTGEAHARAVQNYANYLSDSIHNYRKMLASRMPRDVSDAYISHLLEQEVKWLNQQSRDEGVRIIYKLDTSGGLNNADFKLEFMYPDQRKIK